MSARDVIAEAIRIEAEQDLIAAYDAESVTARILSAFAAAGYAVVPVEDTQNAVEFIDMWAGDNSDRANLAVWTAIRQLRAMLAAAGEPGDEG